MTILSKNPVLNIIPANNNGFFTFTFRGFTEVADSSGTGLKNIQVYVWDGTVGDVPIQQIQGTDFTVTQLSNETGQIQFLNSRTIPSGQYVVIYSDVPYTQEISFPTNQPVNPASVELMGDRLEMQIKQLLEFYKTTVRTEFPPTVAGYELTIKQPLVENSPLVFIKDSPTHWRIGTTPFTIPDFQQLAQDALDAKLGALQAKLDAETARTLAAQFATDASGHATAASGHATAASGHATNAGTAAAGSLQSSIQSAASATTSGQFAQQAEGFKNGAEAAKNGAEAAETATEQLKTDVTILVNRVPDPTGQPPDKTLLTDGTSSWKFGDIPVVKNLDTAALGSSVVVSRDIVTGKNILNAGSLTATSTRQVGTVRPAVEGGVNAETALVSHETRLQALEKRGSGFPWSTQNGNTVFIPNLDADLVSTVGSNILLPNNVRDSRLETVGGLSFFSAGSSYDVPPTIGNLTLLTAPFTLILGLYIDGNTPIPTVILTQTGPDPRLKIQYTATGLELSLGTAVITWPVVLNEYLVYYITFNGSTFAGFRTRIDQGVVEDVVLTPLAITGSLRASGFSLTAATELRVYRFGLLNVLTTQQEANSYTGAIFNIGPTATGTPLEFVNTPVGFTLSPTANLGPLSKDGTYALVLRRNSQTNQYEVDTMFTETRHNKSPNTVKYPALSATTPTKIATASINNGEIYIDNRTDKEVYVSNDLAGLTADNTLGIRIPAGAAIKTNWTTDAYAVADPADAAATDFLVVTITELIPV